MTENEHSDVSGAWLIFFFVCFGIVVLGIGVYTAINSSTNPPETKPSGGHSRLTLPQNDPHSPPWLNSRSA